MSDYVDGDLDRSQRRRLERHVRFCERCHTVLENLRRTLGRLRSLRERDLPGSDAGAVSERIVRAWRERA